MVNKIFEEVELDYTKKGNIKRKQHINRKFYKYMEKYSSLKLAEDGMKLIKRIMDLDSDSYEWIIVVDKTHLIKKPFIVFQELSKTTGESDLKIGIRKIKFTFRPNQNTKRCFWYYESEVQIPEVEEKLKKLIKERLYGESHTNIIKFKSKIRGNQYIILEE